LTLIAVTKTWPATDVEHLAALGVRDFGENRDGEAAAKVFECAALGLTGLRWHFIGQVQTNKAASVAAYADVVHSVDRLRLVDAIGRGSSRLGRVLDVLVQVDLDSRGVDPARGAVAARGGARPGDLPALCAAIAAAASLRLRGVMGVAPLGVPAGGAFADLARAAAEVRALDRSADWISAGMSADLEEAIAHGATHLRVGSGLLGRRPRTR
jgi:PLP dependent protein